MKRLSVTTKKDVLSFLLNTAAKRMIAIKRINKTEPDNPCYACIKAYLDSKNSKVS